MVKVRGILNSRTGARTKLHKIQIVVLCVAMTRFRHEMRHCDIEMTYFIAPRTLRRKNYNFYFMKRCPCSCANTFIVLTFKIPLILTLYGHLTGSLNFVN